MGKSKRYLVVQNLKKKHFYKKIPEENYATK